MKLDPNLRKQIAVDAIAAWLLEHEDESVAGPKKDGAGFLESHRDGEHGGDCTKQAWQCLRCLCEMRLSNAEAIIEAVGAAAGGSE